MKTLNTLLLIIAILAVVVLLVLTAARVLEWSQVSDLVVYLISIVGGTIPFLPSSLNANAALQANRLTREEAIDIVNKAPLTPEQKQSLLTLIMNTIIALFKIIFLKQFVRKE